MPWLWLDLVAGSGSSLTRKLKVKTLLPVPIINVCGISSLLHNPTRISFSPLSHFSVNLPIYKSKQQKSVFLKKLLHATNVISCGNFQKDQSYRLNIFGFTQIGQSLSNILVNNQRFH